MRKLWRRFRLWVGYGYDVNGDALVKWLHANGHKDAASELASLLIDLKAGY